MGQSVCLVLTRPWVPSLVPQNKENKCVYKQTNFFEPRFKPVCSARSWHLPCDLSSWDFYSGEEPWGEKNGLMPLRGTRRLCYSPSTFQATHRALPQAVITDSMLSLCARESTLAALLLTPCWVLALKLEHTERLPGQPACYAECESREDFCGVGGGGLLPENSRACIYSLDPSSPPSLKGGMETSGEGHRAGWDGFKAAAGSWGGTSSGSLLWVAPASALGDTKPSLFSTKTQMWSVYGYPKEIQWV